MEVYKCERLIKVGDAPVGLFLLEDSELICISEYSTGGRRDAIIVSSGEYYHGEGDEGLGHPVIIG